MMDPRIDIIENRLTMIQRLVAIGSGKGGVGKSMVASTTALTLARQGYRVGLFDIDFTSPSTHVILNVDDLVPEEEKGLIPPFVHGVHYMSITYFSRNAPTPLRGVDASNALIELLAITRWSDLDYLIFDMPPGIGDLTLDVIRLIPNLAFILVTTPSKVSFETVRKLLQLLHEQQVPIIGVIENMSRGSSSYIQNNVEQLGHTYLGAIPFDSHLEAAIGNVPSILASSFMTTVNAIMIQSAFRESKNVS
jgi:ATP-binding protein involved in chromosome partitioning